MSKRKWVADIIEAFQGGMVYGFVHSVIYCVLVYAVAEITKRVLRIEKPFSKSES